MEKVINHNFKGKIWNTTFSEEFCVVEIRDELTRQVTFACINLLTNNVLWEDIRPEKSWWLSLVGIFDGYLFLHKYSSNQKPEPEGLLILNVETGDTIERLSDWIFFKYFNSLLTVYQLQNNEPVYMNVDLKKNRDGENCVSQNLSIEKSPTEFLPIHYPEDSPHFSTIYKFLYRLLNIDAVKAVDYLEIGTKIIISYYIYIDKSFLNYILVANRTRQILLNDLIAETEGIGIDTFTVKSDTLLYVKNQTQFIGYRL